MKHKFIYMLTALMAVTVTSCKDDDITGVSSASELDRMPRTMFCTQESTGEDKESNVHCVEAELNTIYLSWFNVNDAAGYHIRYAVSTGVTSGEPADWDKNRAKEIFVGKDVLDYVPSDIKSKAKVISSIRTRDDFKQIKDEDEYIIIPVDINEMELFNLEYSTDYRFAIKVLSKRGPEHDSEWYGYGNGQHWAEYCGMGTKERYATPEVIKYTARGNNSIDVNLNLNVAAAEKGSTAAEKTSYKTNFEITSDGKSFVADMIKVTPDINSPDAALDQKWKNGVPLSELNVVDGVADFTITNLDQNTTYIINLYNSNIDVPVDAFYNTIAVRTTGDRREPERIWCKWEADTNRVAAEYKACRIDTILNNFMDDNTYPEGQVFYLSGDSTYYFATSVSLYKGFTLETYPEDVARGKRAKVLMGGLESKQGNRDVATVGQLVLGRAKNQGEADAPLNIDKICFRNLDIDAPASINYGEMIEGKGTLTGNYFLNMLSNGMGIRFNEFEIRNCTFQGLVRGFFRLQGAKTKIFNKMVVDNCVFYNCGYYSSNGNSYSMFCGDGASAKSNPWNDFRFMNNTIYDSPWVHMFLFDNNKNLDYAIRWNVRIENNTFVNFNTCASGRYVINSQYFPAGSFLSFKNNLIVLAKDDRDIRPLNNQFGNLKNIKGDITWDVENNYSVGCQDKHLKNDGIWSSKPISDTGASIGKFWNATPGLLQGDASYLQTKVGDPALLATELFKAPNPPYYQFNPATPNGRDHAAPDNIWDALRIVPSGRCTSDHEIIVKKIGAPRWYSSDPEHYMTAE